MKYSTDKSFCEELDQKDSLKSYKDLFFIPKNKQGKDLIYFCGNSLGLQPKKTKEYNLLDEKTVEKLSEKIEKTTNLVKYLENNNIYPEKINSRLEELDEK